MLRYSDSELEEIKKNFPDSKINYNKNKNRLYMELKITPRCYVEDKTQLFGWAIKACNKNQKESVDDGKYFIVIMLENRKVFELSEKIEQTAKELGKSNLDLHLLEDKSCCLGINIEEPKLLSEFVLQDVYPYFVWQAYYAKYKKVPPVGEYSHGSKGIKEAEHDHKQTMVLPNKAGAFRNKLCPCGSGKKYKKCCGILDDEKKVKLLKFKRKGDCQVFRVS